MGAGTDTKAASAKLTANPRPAPLICCARQDQPSFKHWLPCAALCWSCAGGRCTASRLLCTHSRSPSSLPLFLTTYHHHHTPPHHHHQLRRPKSALVTRRPTSPPCDRREKIQLTHFSLPSPPITLEPSLLLGREASIAPLCCRRGRIRFLPA